MKSSFGLLAAIACAWSNTLATAMTVTSSGTQPYLSSSIEQPLATIWSVSDATSVHKLAIKLPGNVVISVDPGLEATGALLQVHVSGNSSALLDAIDVKQLEHVRYVNGDVVDRILVDGAVQVKLKHANIDATGFLFSEIKVAHAHVIDELDVAMASNVVVNDGTLVTSNPDARVQLAFSGELDNAFIKTSSPINVYSLEMATTGDGTVQFEAPQIETSHHLDVMSSGASTISLSADSIKTGQLNVALSGSTQVYVQTPNLAAKDIHTAMSGDATVTYATAGSCETHAVELSGSPVLNAGSIVCGTTDVALSGAPKVIVHVTDTLRVSSVFSNAHVEYVGEKPHTIQIEPTRPVFFRSDDEMPMVIPVDAATQPDLFEIQPVPVLTPLLVHLKIEVNKYGIGITVSVDVNDGSVQSPQVTSFSFGAGSEPEFVTKAVPHNAMILVGVIMVALVVKSMREHHRRRRREEAIPLFQAPIVATTN